MRTCWCGSTYLRFFCFQPDIRAVFLGLVKLLEADHNSWRFFVWTFGEKTCVIYVYNISLYAQTHTKTHTYIYIWYIYIHQKMTPFIDFIECFFPKNGGGRTSLNSSHPASRFQEQEMICLQRLQNSRIVTQSVLEDWMVGKYVSRMDGKCFWWWVWSLRNTNVGCYILRNDGNESCWLVT